MKQHICFLITAVLSFSMATPACNVTSEQTADAEALVSKAWTLEDWGEGMPPLSLAADVQITDAKGALAPGKYTFDRVSPTQWREHIKFNGYERLRVRNAEGYWQSRSVDFEPESISQLSRLLHFQGSLKWSSQQTLGKAQDRKGDGVQLQCVEIREAKFKDYIDRRLCFDSSEGTLKAIEYPTNGYSNAPEVSEIEFASFKPVGSKLVPTEIRAFKGKKIISSVSISQITLMTELPPELFVQPQNAQFWPYCEDMQKAELDRRVQPIYPPDAKRRHQSGTVSLYALIERNGSITHLLVTRSAGPLLDAAAGQAVSQWHYKPAMCGLTTIPTETSISVDFGLQQ